MEGNLPEDIVCAILIRLPVKSLLRFRCVCKSWYSLISSSNFIDSQKNYTKKRNNDDLLLLREFSFPEYYFGNEIGTYKIYATETLDPNTSAFIFPFVNSYFIMKSCINGLTCLLEKASSDHTLILWNPSIRKYFVLPSPNIAVDLKREIVIYGFGYGCTTKDYKVVRIICSYDKHMRLQMVRQGLEIFRLSNGTWQSLELEAPYNLPWIDRSQPTFLNGAIHWRVLNEGQNYVLVFNLDTEKFNEIQVPRVINELGRDDSRYRDLALEALHGMLSMFEYTETSVTLWVMKQYNVPQSWSKNLVIKKEGVKLNWVVLVKRNGNIMFSGTVGGNSKLLLYNEDFNRLEECESDITKIVQIASSLESLSLLDNPEAKTY